MARATHLVARTVFDWLRERNPELDLYRLLRTGGAELSLPMGQVHQRVRHYLRAARAERDRGRLLLDGMLRDGDEASVTAHALKLFGSYHRRPALTRRGDRLFHDERKLLLYYQNRLEGWRPAVEVA